MTTTAGTLIDAGAMRGKVWNGGWSDAAGTIEVREPASGELLAVVGRASGDDVRTACMAAAAAQPRWAATPGEERAALMERAADVLEAHHEELERWDARETGATQPKAEFEVMKLAAGELREAARLLERPMEEVVDDPTRTRSVNRRVPIGVVGVIAPWNFPLVLGMRSVAPALALGNAVVLKPDPHTPITGGFAMALVLAEAGLPAGLFHVVPGGAEAGEALCTAPEVGMVSFTGSTAVGRKVGALAGGELKRVALELGGNNAFVVLDDADPDAASSAGAWGSFLHQGQICMAAGRHIVHERLADRYIEALAERARRLPAGDPQRGEVALGPIIDRKQFERVEAIVRDGVERGARVHAGGEPNAPFYPATVISDVSRDMRLWREEIFGPVAPVVTFSSDEEAIELANDTEYGLSGGIYTTSLERGRRIAAELRTGLVHIGDQTVNDEPAIAFGGIGASGNGGRFGGPANLEAFTQWRWLTEREEPATYPF